RSWNCGVEGRTDDRDIEALRNRQGKNFLACTMLSFGMPMVAMGDEVRRTQLGNNNAYCQDNEGSWFDWSLVTKHAGVLRFTKLLIDRRLARSLGEGETLTHWLSAAKRAWHGVKLNQPDWSPWSHSVALTAELKQDQLFVHWILNAYSGPLDFELPFAGTW